MKIDSPAARLYNVAEYFFNEEATQYLELTQEAIDHVYNTHDDANVRVAFERYLRGDELTFSSGICEGLTAGFVKCDYYGYWEYPLPMDFVDRFYGVK